ncbi:putative rab geranylgeranyl transferase type II beta subunit, partial [Tribonema minus]
MPPFLGELHRQYILKVSKDKDSFEYLMTEHLRMSGVYWGLMGLALMGRDVKEEMGGGGALADWVMRCYCPAEGGFGGGEGHDPHILYTLSALQVLALLGELRRADAAAVTRYVAALQRPDGAFAGDRWGEVDTRFSYCALASLALLGTLRGGAVDVGAAAAFVARCRNFDGGFGCAPGAESHAGQVFTCVGALAIARALHLVDAPLLGWWLCARQCDSGGLNGRPEKQADVCYSWWILSALAILGRRAWIDGAALARFILRCQDGDGGGVAERPGNMADIFHTFFGIAGLVLLGHLKTDGSGGADGIVYCDVDPVYALPSALVRELGLESQVLEPVPAAAAAAA